MYITFYKPLVSHSDRRSANRKNIALFLIRKAWKVGFLPNAGSAVVIFLDLEFWDPGRVLWSTKKLNFLMVEIAVGSSAVTSVAPGGVFSSTFSEVSEKNTHLKC